MCVLVFVYSYVALLCLAPLAERNPPEGCTSSLQRLENTFWWCSTNLRQIKNAFLLKEHAGVWALPNGQRCINYDESRITGEYSGGKTATAWTLTRRSLRRCSTIQTKQLPYLGRNSPNPHLNKPLAPGLTPNCCLFLRNEVRTRNETLDVRVCL